MTVIRVVSGSSAEIRAARTQACASDADSAMAMPTGGPARGSAAPKARKRGRPSRETAFAKANETLFAEEDEMTEGNLAVLDELLKG